MELEQDLSASIQLVCAKGAASARGFYFELSHTEADREDLLLGTWVLAEIVLGGHSLKLIQH